MKKDKDILIGEGTESLHFGTSAEMVQQLIGPADEIINETNEEEDLLLCFWHYDDLDLSLVFVKDDAWLLDSISVTGEHYELDKQKVIGISKSELIQLLEEIDLGIISIEKDPESQSELVFIEDANITFWIENDQVTELAWGWIDDEDYC